MPPPRRLHAAFLLLLSLLNGRWCPASASALSTFALAKADTATIVCGLLPSASSPLLVDLNCTAAGGDHARQETYPSSHPFSALAGGDDFLCAVGPSGAGAGAGAVDMRWWDLSPSGGSASKRVYSGRPLQALASGDYRVYSVLQGGELHCWRWRGLRIPAGLCFVNAAVGDSFVCAILNGTSIIRCFGSGTGVAARGHPQWHLHHPLLRERDWRRRARGRRRRAERRELQHGGRMRRPCVRVGGRGDHVLGQPMVQAALAARAPACRCRRSDFTRGKVGERLKIRA